MAKLPSDPSVSDRAAVREFRGIARDFLAQTYERFPEMASRLGLAGFDARLSANGPQVHRAQVHLTAHTLARIEALPEAAFRGDDWLDRRFLLGWLRSDLLDGRDLQRWRRDPQGHCDAAVGAILDLLTANAGKLARVMPVIEARLKQIPDFLAAGLRCIQQPVPLWTRLAQTSCAGAMSFLAEIEPELVAHATSGTRVRQLLAAASKAFAGYAQGLARRTPGPVGGYAIGRANFELLMRERLGLDWSLPEALANGKRLVARMRDELVREAARHGRRDPLALIAEVSAAWRPERPLIDEYRIATAAIKKRLQSLDLVTMPRDERLEILPLPAFLSHVAPTALYFAPPPFAKRRPGVFWVNDLSLGHSDERKRRAELSQHFDPASTSAHEAYPGHHLQFAIQNQHSSKLRRLANHMIFAEGWTLWCEGLAVEHRLVDDPHARLMQIHASLWRAYRIVIDCGLHGGTLSLAGARKMLVDGLGFTPARAAGEVNWYTSAPTVPMSYLLGRLEMERLHQRFVVGEGWTLKRFHDWVLSHGALPFSWIMHAYDQR